MITRVKPPYPLYKRSLRSSIIVRFDKVDAGAVIRGNLHYHEGQYSRSWVNCTNKDRWRDLDDSEINAIGISSNDQYPLRLKE